MTVTYPEIADAAQGYFEAAGYTLDGDHLVDSSGQQLELTITTANGWTDWLRAAQAVQDQLEDVGISVEIDQPQPAAYQQALASGSSTWRWAPSGGQDRSTRITTHC